MKTTTTSRITLASARLPAFDDAAEIPEIPVAEYQARLHETVLPPSNTAGWIPPYAFSPNRILVRHTLSGRVGRATGAKRS